MQLPSLRHTFLHVEVTQSGRVLVWWQRKRVGFAIPNAESRTAARSRLQSRFIF
jgi:hypothetical protein